MACGKVGNFQNRATPANILYRKVSLTTVDLIKLYFNVKKKKKKTEHFTSECKSMYSPDNLKKNQINKKKKIRRRLAVLQISSNDMMIKDVLCLY